MHHHLVTLSLVATLPFLAAPARALAPPPAAALPPEVHVVDVFAGPGTDFTQVDDAVAAASDGDTILVREGSYIGFTVAAKSLTVTADRDALVSLIGTVRVEQLPASGSVVLRGLHVETLTNGAGLVVEDCDGPVWVEDGSFSGPSLPQSSAPGARVANSAAVTFHRCELEGSRGLTVGGDTGLASVGSSVYLHDTIARGGTGNAGGGLPGQGGAGARALDSLLYAAGGSMQGGDGGPSGGIFGCADGGAGGVGLELAGATSFAHLIEVLPLGGAAGPSTPPCSPGVPGVDFDGPAGSLLTQAFPARALQAANPVRGGETLELAIGGVPGDLVLLWLAPGQSPFYVAPSGGPLFPLLGGVFLTAAPGAVLLVPGSVGPGGELLLPFALPEPPGESLGFFLQAAHIAAGAPGEIALGPGQAVTLLSSSF